MNTYCLSCKKDTKNIDSKVTKTKNNRKMMLSKCSICKNKKSTFISEGSGIFDSLVYNTNRDRIKMSNVINKFLLAGDKFMPEMHLKQSQFVYRACGPFTRHKERIKKFKQTGDTRYIYADHKDLINRTKSDKVLRDKAYDIASNPEYDGYQRNLASMVYKFFDKKSTAEPSSLERIGSGIASSSILANELHKPVIKKFNKRKIYS